MRIPQFGGRLKAARQKRGWTQKDVAQQLGISAVAYGDYERGRIFPAPENLRALCRIFDELSFDEMYRLFEEERAQDDVHKAHTWLSKLRSLPAAARADAAARSGQATAFVVNTGQEVPLTIPAEPVLSSEGILTIEIDLHFDKAGAKLDVIDLRSVECLKTFDLPARFLSVDVSNHEEYASFVAQMKQQQLQTLPLRKAAFAYRIWWTMEEPQE